ncbi:MAG TPA: class I SAM-dependent methyltransferase [Pyrinomonadaceae bacterium]|jgi:16S rRNA A1518/A1519 N6-dimethyltransferase RsmA/KsgA/DIM1 with predicted DNA glycosylase/AP lyase activity|nr:class I SAM-dependent methyltransferase [Pyrinomonadaceae bacterium]
MNKQEHWENIYGTKQPTDVSWFRLHLDKSLELIESAKLNKDAAIIDIGCGASTLIDDLLDRGYTNLSCLEISGGALETTKKRLGKLAANVL